MKDGGYKRLKERCANWVSAVRHPHVIPDFFIEQAKLDDGWKLATLYATAKTMDLAGYDTRLVATHDGLACQFVKRPGIPPV